MVTLSVDQIAALAPDSASASAGRGLAKANKWPALKRSSTAIWGECQGSGKNPYRTGVDLENIAFKCSCPSRKFPCKHAIGLLYLAAESAASFTDSSLEGWIAEWIEKRGQAAEKKAAKAESDAEELTPEEASKRAKAASKRVDKREENVVAAIASTQQWLEDMTRQGLASVRQQPLRSFDAVAARLVDQQAPGLARMARKCGDAIASGDDWADRFLEQVGLINLLLKAYSRQDAISPESRADARAAIGWTIPEADVLAIGVKVEDRWIVVAQVIELEGTLRAQRTWLHGANSGRSALHLSFSAGQQPLDTSFLVGSGFEGTLAFYPSTVPLRVIVAESKPTQDVPLGNSGYDSVESFLSFAAESFASNPWVERLPCLIHGMVLIFEETTWNAVDSVGHALPLANDELRCWELFALSGGTGSLRLFGEWDGRSFTILSAFQQERLIVLQSERTSS